MVYPPPAVPCLAAIAGRDADAVRAAADRYGCAAAYTDWHDLIADPAVLLVDNGGPYDLHAEGERDESHADRDERGPAHPIPWTPGRNR